MYPYSPQGGTCPPPQQGSYPPPQQGAYPPQGMSYSPSGGSYLPPQQGTYPPPQQGAYPPQGMSYPPSGGSYLPPQQGTYPPPQQGAYPSQGMPYPPSDAKPGYSPTRDASFQCCPPPQSAPNVSNFNQPQTNLLSREECDAAAKILRDAMKGLGTDEKALISVLGKYPPLQMNQIIKSYTSNYGKRLVDDVKSDTSGDFGKLACALSMSIADYDVKCLHNAIARLGTDDDCLIEILVGRTNSDIRALRELYKKKYGKDIENDVKGDTSGYVRRLYIVLLEGNRDESDVPRDALADAEALYNAGEGKIGTDEMTFISILCNRPDSHLRKVFDIYQQKHGHTIEQAISKEFSGDIKKALTNLVASIRNKAEYIASLFEKSMKGLGTDDDKLIRLTVRHRAPYVIEPIKEAYKTKYGKTLAKRIKGDTSGNYCKLLLACIHDDK